MTNFSISSVRHKAVQGRSRKRSQAEGAFLAPRNPLGLRGTGSDQDL